MRPTHKPICTAEKLFLRGSSYRANVCTVAAADALISIDNVNAVTLGNATYGALACASTASYAIIGNFVCHSDIPPYL